MPRVWLGGRPTSLSTAEYCVHGCKQQSITCSGLNTPVKTRQHQPASQGTRNTAPWPPATHLAQVAADCEVDNHAHRIRHGLHFYNFHVDQHGRALGESVDKSCQSGGRGILHDPTQAYGVTSCWEVRFGTRRNIRLIRPGGLGCPCWWSAACCLYGWHVTDPHTAHIGVGLVVSVKALGRALGWVVSACRGAEHREDGTGDAEHHCGRDGGNRVRSATADVARPGRFLARHSRPIIVSARVGPTQRPGAGLRR